VFDRENVLANLQFRSNAKGIEIEKGQEIGMFKFGSSIALLFEAKSGEIEWFAKAGDKVRYG